MSPWSCLRRCSQRLHLRLSSGFQVRESQLLPRLSSVQSAGALALIAFILRANQPLDTVSIHHSYLNGCLSTSNLATEVGLNELTECRGLTILALKTAVCLSSRAVLVCLPQPLLVKHELCGDQLCTHKSERRVITSRR